MLQFKFKFIDEEGNEEGFMSKRGVFAGDVLNLDGEELPTMAIRKVLRRFNRLILDVMGADGADFVVAFAVTGGDIAELQRQINAVTSRRWAEAHSQALVEEGLQAHFRTQECPHCRSMINLTAFAHTPQCYCTYCDALVTLEGQGPSGEGEYRICDSCGYYARPQEFTVFYFYFLLVIYGFRSRKVYMCSGCMRPEAWKMLAGNALFLLGLPVALWQLARVYRPGAQAGFPGLDTANAHARKGKMQQALLGFEAAEGPSKQGGLQGSAGICFNRGRALLEEGDLQQAAAQLQGALALCSNHRPAFEMLAACYEMMNDEASFEALVEGWGTLPVGEGQAAGEEMVEA